MGISCNWWPWIVASICFCFCGSVTQGLAQEETVEDRSIEAQGIIEAARFFRMEGSRQVPVAIRKKPVFQHLDAVRGEQGAIWVVGDKGRPIAISVVYLKSDEPNWVHAIRSLSPSKDIGADLLVSRRWRPNSAGVSFRKLPLGPKPSAVAKLRTLQLRQQAKRFSGFEGSSAKQFAALRLIPRELHSYQDPENGILAGAVFALAHNTNPEVFLMLEVHENGETTEWRYALGRFTFVEVHVLLDRKEVWQQDGISTARRNQPYYISHVPRQ